MKESNDNTGIEYAAENFNGSGFQERIFPSAVCFSKQGLDADNFSREKAPVKNVFKFIRQDKNSLLTEPAKSNRQDKPNLLRLFVKNGEYVYARPNDIIMIESCDHLVKVHLAVDSNVKKAVRNNTLKDFLLLLPQEQFTRIGRFCAVNIARLSGGNCKEQTFEFDFKISVKLKRPISQSHFTAIGK